MNSLSYEKISSKDPKLAEFNTDDFLLLREVLSKHRPDLLPILKLVGSNELPINRRGKLCDIVAGELYSTGLEADYEPNARGRALEDLIDKIWFYA